MLYLTGHTFSTRAITTDGTRKVAPVEATQHYGDFIIKLSGSYALFKTHHFQKRNVVFNCMYLFFSVERRTILYKNSSMIIHGGFIKQNRFSR